ncbi:MAG: OmpW family outer membrane protein [Thermoanaerobaculia bacterium]
MRSAVLSVLLLAAPLHAADIEVGVQHVIAIAGDTGELDVATSRGFGAHLDVFWSDRVSTRVAAVFVNPAAILYPDNPPPGDVDLGTLGLDIYSATARFHIAPRARFSAFAGAGAALVTIGNLDDQFGDAVEIEFDQETALVAEAGVRYRVYARIVFEASVVYVPLEIEGNVRRATDPRIVVPSPIGVDPLVVNIGAAWRF